MEILAAKATIDHAFIFGAAAFFFAAMSIAVGWFACTHTFKAFRLAFRNRDPGDHR